MAIAVILISVYLVQNLDEPQSNPSVTIIKAAIIDQLNDDIPNQYFQDQAFLLVNVSNVDQYLKI